MSLRQFPASRIAGAYRLTSNRQWHYAERFAIAAVEYCCYSVFRKLGPQVWPLLVMDCSTSTGGTPPNRHPPGSHNNGVNLDLGYYGLVDLRPSLVPGPHNTRRMTGPPDPRKFAAAAEVEWFLAMGRLEVDVGGVLVRLCATDPFIERHLDPKIQLADAAPSVKEEALRICFSSGTGGWQDFHHTHRHVRFNRMQNGNELADYIERVWIQPLLQTRLSPVLARAEADEVVDVPQYVTAELEIYDEVRKTKRERKKRK